METRTTMQKMKDARDRKVAAMFKSLKKRHPELAMSRAEEIIGGQMARQGLQPVTRYGVHQALLRQGMINKR